MTKVFFFVGVEVEDYQSLKVDEAVSVSLLSD